MHCPRPGRGGDGEDGEAYGYFTPVKRGRGGGCRRTRMSIRQGGFREERTGPLPPWRCPHNNSMERSRGRTGSGLVLSSSQETGARTAPGARLTPDIRPDTVPALVGVGGEEECYGRDGQRPDMVCSFGIDALRGGTGCTRPGRLPSAYPAAGPGVLHHHRLLSGESSGGPESPAGREIHLYERLCTLTPSGGR